MHRRDPFDPQHDRLMKRQLRNVLCHFTRRLIRLSLTDVPQPKQQAEERDDNSVKSFIQF